MEHWIDEPGRWEGARGILAELRLPRPLEDLELPVESLGGDLSLAFFPWDPEPTGLRLEDAGGSIPGPLHLSQLLEAEGFAYVPSARRIGAGELGSQGGAMLPQRLNPYAPDRLRLAGEDQAAFHVFPSFVEGHRLRLFARGAEGARLRFTLDGEERGILRFDGADWQRLELAFDASRALHRMRLESLGEGAVELAWIEILHAAPPLAVVRGPVQPPLRADFTPRPPRPREERHTQLGTPATLALWRSGGPRTARFDGAELEAQVETEGEAPGAFELRRAPRPGWALVEDPWARLYAWVLDPRLSLDEAPPDPPRSAPAFRFLADLDGERRPALWLPPPSSIEARVQLSPGDRVRLALGIADPPPLDPLGELEARRTSATPAEPGPVDFALSWIDASGEETLLGRATLASTGSGWIEQEWVVPPAISGAGRLRFASVGNGPAAFAVADPRVLRAERAEPPLNVLVYLIDTLRADALSCYGAELPSSPHLDRLAAEGFRFENFYAVASWTRPTTATVLTGYYPDWHGMGRELPLPRSLTTLAESLAADGRSSWAAVANVQVGGLGLAFEQGFHRFADPERVGRELPDRRGHASSEQVGATATEWLRTHGDEPFFLYLHSLDPHMPYAPPAHARSPFGHSYRGVLLGKSLRHAELLALEGSLGEVDRRYVEAVYANEVEHQDAQIGALRAELEELDLLGNTVLVVLSDHGEEFLEHGDWSHGYRMWEELLRVPFILWLPPGELARRGLEPGTIADPVSQVDFAPGLLDLLAVADPFPRQGRSWLALLAGGQADLAPFFGEDYQAWEGDEIGTLRSGSHKLIWNIDHAAGTTRERLFDLARDPGEREDLSAREPALLQRLRQERALLREEAAAVRARLDRGGWEHVRPAAEDGTPVLLEADALRELEALGYLDDH